MTQIAHLALRHQHAQPFKSPVDINFPVVKSRLRFSYHEWFQWAVGSKKVEIPRHQFVKLVYLAEQSTCAMGVHWKHETVNDYAIPTTYAVRTSVFHISSIKETNSVISQRKTTGKQQRQTAVLGWFPRWPPGGSCFPPCSLSFSSSRIKEPPWLSR